METKICAGCGEEKPITSFKKMKEYRATKCKECARPAGTRYFGKVCDKHPELNGERLSSNSRCIGCHNTKRHDLTRNKYHSDEGFKQNYLTKKAERKARSDYSYSFHASLYRARLKQATPVWSDKAEIKKIYKLRDVTPGMAVDHFFPLAGETVCGPHVPSNLRLIPQDENDRKSNRHPEDFYGPDYMKLLEK